MQQKISDLNFPPVLQGKISTDSTVGINDKLENFYSTSSKATMNKKKKIHSKEVRKGATLTSKTSKKEASRHHTPQTSATTPTPSMGLKKSATNLNLAQLEQTTLPPAHRSIPLASTRPATLLLPSGVFSHKGVIFQPYAIRCHLQLAHGMDCSEKTIARLLDQNPLTDLRRPPFSPADLANWLVQQYHQHLQPLGCQPKLV